MMVIATFCTSRIVACLSCDCESVKIAAAMEEIYREFESYLGEIRKRYANDPRSEMLELLLLSLEREQIVSVAYRESVIEARLQQLKTTPEIRRVIQYALAWAWKDEE